MNVQEQRDAMPPNVNDWKVALPPILRSLLPQSPHHDPPHFDLIRRPSGRTCILEHSEWEGLPSPYPLPAGLLPGRTAKYM